MIEEEGAVSVEYVKIVNSHYFSETKHSSLEQGALQNSSKTLEEFLLEWVFNWAFLHSSVVHPPVLVHVPVKPPMLLKKLQ